MANSFSVKRSPLVTKTFLSILVPTILMNLTTAIGSMADTVIIGQYLDDLSLSGVTYATPIYMVINTIAALFAIGGCIAVSVDTGKGEKTSANRAFSMSVICLVFLSMLLFFAGVFFTKQITVMLGAGNELVFDKVKTYVQIILLGAPIFILNISCAFFVRNDGRPTLSMVGMISGMGIDIILNLVFVGFMSMGVAGAAISTVIGQGVGLVIVGSHFFSKKNTLKFCFCFNSSVWRIIKNGIGSALSFVYQFVTIIIMNHYVVQISGPEGIVIYTVVFNLCTVSLAVFEGLSQTIQPMVSLYFGEKSNKKVKDSVKLAILSAVIICGSVMAILEAFPAIVPHMFGISESGLIQQSALAVRIYTTSMFIMTLNVIIGNYLQSIELGQITSVLVSLRCCVLLLVCVFILGRIFGLGGIWAAYTVAEILTFIVFMVINIIKREKLSKNNVSADIFFLDKRVEESCKSLVYKCNTNEYESFCNEIKTIADKIAIYNEKMLITALEYLSKLKDVIVDKKGKYIEVEFNASDEKIIISDNLSHDKLKVDFAKITDEDIEYGPVLGLNRISIKRS